MISIWKEMYAYPFGCNFFIDIDWLIDLCSEIHLPTFVLVRFISVPFPGVKVKIDMLEHRKRIRESYAWVFVSIWRISPTCIWKCNQMKCTGSNTHNVFVYSFCFLHTHTLAHVCQAHRKLFVRLVCQQISFRPWFTTTASLLKTLASFRWNIEQQLIEAINQLNLYKQARTNTNWITI